MAHQGGISMDDQHNRNDDPFGYPYGKNPSGSFGPGYSGSADAGRQYEQPRSVVPVTREYRPFTVSGGDADWGDRPKRRSSFKAVFASFLAGVLVMGGLMFAADRGNWFTESTQTATPQVTEAKPASATVSNAVDTVRPNNIAKIFEQASPAVVKIETSVKGRSPRGSTMDLFEQFFGQSPGGGTLRPSGMGSGFIFDKEGYILTNQHVIADADEIEVTVVGYNKPFKAKLLGSSYELDLAVIKIDGDNNFPTLKIGNSDEVHMGDWVIAIGNPYGFDHTITVGVLSSNEREISITDSSGTRNYQHLLQTDASINPGNSGGPLLNLNGEVIGINTAVSAQAQGIGFAIPSSTILEVLDHLKNNREIPKKPVPFIGASLQTLTPEFAERLGIKGTEGSVVVSVIYGSPAYKADLRAYDVITGMDGVPYKTNTDLIAAIQKKNVGDKIVLNVIRNGEKIDLTVTIGDRNEFEANQR
jgi:S1-C subfamily serine protease